MHRPHRDCRDRAPCSIDAVLDLRRDDFIDAVRQNRLAPYEFPDAIIHDGLDLFSDPGLEALLKLNHLVLLGRKYVID